MKIRLSGKPRQILWALKVLMDKYGNIRIEELCGMQ